MTVGCYLKLLQQLDMTVLEFAALSVSEVEDAILRHRRHKQRHPKQSPAATPPPTRPLKRTKTKGSSRAQTRTQSQNNIQAQTQTSARDCIPTYISSAHSVESSIVPVPAVLAKPATETVRGSIPMSDHNEGLSGNVSGSQELEARDICPWPSGGQEVRAEPL